MTLLDNMAGAVDTLIYDSVGDDTITYGGVEVNAIVDYEEHLEEEQRRDMVRSKAILWVRKSEIAAWSYDDAVVIDGDTWRVKSKKEENWQQWGLNIERDLRVMPRRSD